MCCLKTNSTFVSTYIKGHAWAYNWEFLTHIKNPIFILQHCITYDECCPSLELPYSEKTSKFDKWYRPPYKLFHWSTHFTIVHVLRRAACHVMSSWYGHPHTSAYVHYIQTVHVSAWWQRRTLHSCHDSSRLLLCTKVLHEFQPYVMYIDTFVDHNVLH